MKFKYYVLKNYKGVFRKKHTGNVHTLVVPTSINESLYLVIVGEIIKEPNSFACQLIIRQSPEFIEQVIQSEQDKFKNNLILIENLPCRVNDLGQGKYEYIFSRTGKYIKSDLYLTFEPEYTTGKTKIYILRGNIDLETDDVNPKTFKMVAMKKLAHLGRKYHDEQNIRK